MTQKWNRECGVYYENWPQGSYHWRITHRTFIAHQTCQQKTRTPEDQKTPLQNRHHRPEDPKHQRPRRNPSTRAFFPKTALLRASLSFQPSTTTNILTHTPRTEPANWNREEHPSLQETWADPEPSGVNTGSVRNWVSGELSSLLCPDFRAAL